MFAHKGMRGDTGLAPHKTVMSRKCIKINALIEKVITDDLIC
jgi:hypothetical protein